MNEWIFVAVWDRESDSQYDGWHEVIRGGDGWKDFVDMDGDVRTVALDYVRETCNV